MYVLYTRGRLRHVIACACVGTLCSGGRWHTQGAEGGGGKVKGRGGGRLRTPDEVAKLRKRQQWQKFRSMPKTKRRQFLKQNRRQQKQPASRAKAKHK